jgi:hypothetical protein
VTELLTFAPAFTDAVTALSTAEAALTPELIAAVTVGATAELTFPFVFAVLLIAVVMAVFALAPAFNELLTLVDAASATEVAAALEAPVDGATKLVVVSTPVDGASAIAVIEVGEDKDAVSVAPAVPAALPNANDAARLAVANWFLIPSRIDFWLDGSCDMKSMASLLTWFKP